MSRNHADSVPERERTATSERLLEVLGENDAMLLASLHRSPPQIAAATLELAPFALRTALRGMRLLEPHPQDPGLLWISDLGWACIDELAALWSERQLTEHFESKAAEAAQELIPDALDHPSGLSEAQQSSERAAIRTSSLGISSAWWPRSAHY